MWFCLLFFPSLYCLHHIVTFFLHFHWLFHVCLLFVYTPHRELFTCFSFHYHIVLFAISLFTLAMVCLHPSSVYMSLFVTFNHCLHWSRAWFPFICCLQWQMYNCLPSEAVYVDYVVRKISNSCLRPCLHLVCFPELFNFTISFTIA